MRALQSDGLGRLVITLLIAVGLLAAWGLWFLFSAVDVVVVARGTLRPEQPDQPIMTTVAARVQELRVKEGAVVHQGDVLAVLESRLSASEAAELQRQRDNLAVVRRDTREALPLQLSRLTDEEQAEERHLEGLQTLLAEVGVESDSRRREIDAQRQSASLELSRKDEESRRTTMDREQAARTATTAHKVLEANRALADKGLVSKVAMLELENKDQAAATELAKLRSQETAAARAVDQARAHVAELDGTLQTSLAELGARAQDLRNQMDTSKAKINDLDKQCTLLRQSQSVRERNAEDDLKRVLAQTAPGWDESRGGPQGLVELRAPADGRIVALQVKQAGAVVNAGDPLMRILVSGTPLLMEAWVPNRDAGHLRPGLPIRVKFDAFPFETYGAAEGTIVWVSPDSELQTDIGPAYRVKCQLDASKIALMPGLTGSVEIVAERRRVVDIVLQNVREQGDTFSRGGK